MSLLSWLATIFGHPSESSLPSTEPPPQRVRKIHHRNYVALMESYTQSPHVFKAIRERKFTSCCLITDRITDNIHAVTCIECLTRHAIGSNGPRNPNHGY